MKKKLRNLSKILKTPFKKLPKQYQKPAYILSIVILTFIVLGIGYNVWKKHFRTPSANEFFENFQNTKISKMDIDVKINNDHNDIIDKTFHAERDVDTSLITYDDKTLYIDTLDRKYQVYWKEADNWKVCLENKIASLDDARTQYVEVNGKTNSAGVDYSIFENVSVKKNKDKSYEVVGYTNYKNISSILQINTFAITKYDTYSKYKSFFNLYGEDLKVRVIFRFNKDKQIIAWRIEADPEMMEEANKQYSNFNLNELSITVKNISTQAIDIYVPVDIEVKATSTDLPNDKTNVKDTQKSINK